MGMRILQVILGISMKSGGPTRSVKGLCRALDQAGVEVTLLVLGGNDEFEHPGGVQVIYGLRTEPEFIKDFQVVHLHGLWSPKLHQVAVACRRAGVPYVVSPRGMLDPWALSVKKWKKRIARWLYQDRDLRGAAAFHATAELEAENIRKQGFKQPIIIAPNGINLVESGKWKVESVSDDERNGRLSCGNCEALGGLELRSRGRCEEEQSKLTLDDGQISSDAAGMGFAADAQLMSSCAANCLACPSVPDFRGALSSTISHPQYPILSASQVLDMQAARPCNDNDTATIDNQSAEIAPPLRACNDCDASWDGQTTMAQKGRRAVFMGRLHPGKGLLTLAEAWAKVRPQGWKMVVVGPDSYGHKKDIVAKLEELGIRDEWEFVGMVGDEEKWGYYHQASLLLHPSVSENFGITIAEGLAAGLPVICTRGTPWENLEDHKCGWWIDIGVEPLTKALTEAMALSPDELQAMGLRGRKMVEEKYTWGAVAEKMIEGYEEVINART